MDTKISIIGGGNLGIAIAEGLIKTGFAKTDDLIITRRHQGLITGSNQHGFEVTNDNKMAISKAKVVIITLKPYQVKEVIKECADFFRDNQIVISGVTGVSTGELREWMGDKGHLFRVMPNTAIAIGESMTCISGEANDSEEGSYVKRLFEQLGSVVVIEEKLMDAATVLGACGTAFAMRYIRANIQGGIEIGFDAKTASLIAAQTIKGAAQLLMEHGSHPEQEIDKVTTPKGCTIAGLNEMEHNGFSSSLIKGLVTSFEQIQRF